MRRVEGGRPGGVYGDLVRRLFPTVPRGIRWGLERTRGLLASVGDPHRRYPAIHVGGTNGKGSVAALCASALREAGWRVGLYTSPHLCSFRERIQVDGRPVGEGLLVEAGEELRPGVERYGPTFFEASTALAFLVFARTGVEIAVVEVGLGGRLDATNVIVPLVSVITNVALDHRELLGDTLVDVAREKAGIIKEGVPVVTAEPDPLVLEVFREAAGARRAPLRALDAGAELRELEVGLGGTAFAMETGGWGPLPVRIPLIGPHQAPNAAAAILALEALPGGLRPGREALLRGIGAVRWPGRMQVEREGGLTWVLDVAHNTAGVHALAETLVRLPLPRPIAALVGILGDKEWEAMLPPLFALTEAAVLTQPPSAPRERRWDPRAAAARVTTPPRTEIVEDFGEALGRVRELASGGTVVVTGSHHTVGDALALLEREPFGVRDALPVSLGAA